MDGAGRMLAVETIDEVEVDVAPFELEEDAITH